MEFRQSYYSTMISIGQTERIVSSNGVSFFLHAKRFSGTIRNIVGLYFGISGIRAIITVR
jgi:hypothetical protein